MAYLMERAVLQHKMLQAAAALSMRGRRSAFNAWIAMLLQRAQAGMRLRNAVLAFRNRGVKAAFNAWSGRYPDVKRLFTLFERSMRLWAAGEVVKGFFKWVDYAMRMRDAPHAPRPLSPNARRRIAWGKKRVRAAQKLDVAADDKFQCQRTLLAPHAALVLRTDGVVLRVVAVHKSTQDEVCTVDLARGYDRSMLTDSPLPSTAASELAARESGALIYRQSVTTLSAPDHSLLVPQFFGGRLELTNGLDVRVIDCMFEDSQSPIDADDRRPAEPVLTRVLLTLIDGQGVSVGQPTVRAHPPLTRVRGYVDTCAYPPSARVPHDPLQD